MESIVRELGARLSRTSRRGFLGKTARIALAVGSGMVTVTSLNTRQALANNPPCPCGPKVEVCPQEGFCSGCPGSVNGCPSGCTSGWSWWCCVSGVEVQCQDCSGGPCDIAPCHECICYNATSISC